MSAARRGPGAPDNLPITARDTAKIDSARSVRAQDASSLEIDRLPVDHDTFGVPPDRYRVIADRSGAAFARS